MSMKKFNFVMLVHVFLGDLGKNKHPGSQEFIGSMVTSFRDYTFVVGTLWCKGREKITVRNMVEKNYQATCSFGEFDEVNHWIRARLVLGKRRDNARKSNTIKKRVVPSG